MPCQTQKKSGKSGVGVKSGMQGGGPQRGGDTAEELLVYKQSKRYCPVLIALEGSAL